jgi:hypothetical protein
MAGVLAVIVVLDPLLYAGLGGMLPPPYRFVATDAMYFDQFLTLVIGALSLATAVQRTRCSRRALRWTAVTSYAFLFVPSLVSLAPFAFWFFSVRKRERALEGRAA